MVGKEEYKKKVAKAYNITSKEWHKTRISEDWKNLDRKYVTLNRAHIFIEKPAMFSLLPNLRGKKVLCLGCGSGEEIELLEKKGATDITGIDIADKLIEIAKQENPNHNFFVMDAEHLNFESEAFDFIYSSFVLDYFEDWTNVLKEIYRVLKDGGVFQFSDIHPVKWGGECTYDNDGNTTGSLLGFKDGKVYGDYLDIFAHKQQWMNSLETVNYTMPISKMYKFLRDANFNIEDIIEPKIIEEAKEFDLKYYEAHSKIPQVVIFSCRK
jgi:ubiquinone/menaquinone biosynthesis C-methylase UbiE